MGSLHDSVFEIQKKSALAPDGLPWPPGYFDHMPRKTFEDALSEYGVRPNHYYYGWPVYTEVERACPEYKAVIPPESPEYEAEMLADWNEWKKQHPESVEI